ncbi:NAD(P)-binding protein [Mycena sanguinolenta]|uniref:NAD(P)-binding protein n=1 Tax=Mycena sanguinolenta TaxID=230812 RepID=A0A8H7DP59_9AGAR|nr:NAD(P)-binding protein [Mycena sanguinolenta]
MPSYVVAGAARGLGFEFVNQLSSKSDNTVFALIRNKATASTLYEIQESRKNVVIMEADITDSVAVEEAAKAVESATGGTLDYLIIVAALATNMNKPILAFDSNEELDEDLLEHFRTNVLGVVHTIKAFLPLLRGGPTKKVAVLSTGNADLDATLTMASPGRVGYGISKAAMNMAIAKFALALKPEGFVFVSISPGMVDSKAGRRSPENEAVFQKTTERIRVLLPDFKGPITPKQSVDMMLEVIHRWTVEETGQFVSHHGNKQWL